MQRGRHTPFCTCRIHLGHLAAGPEGRAQVEAVFRSRLPLAEFFDALFAVAG